MPRIKDLQNYTGALNRPDIYIPVDGSSFSRGMSLSGQQMFAMCKGTDGRSVELRNNSTFIQWRREGDASWANLVSVSDLSGVDGQEVELRVSSGHIQWRLGSGSWASLVPLADLKGDKGDPAREPVLAASAAPLVPGDNPTASITGVYPNLTLTLGVPRGRDAAPPNLAFSVHPLAPGDNPIVSQTGLYPDISVAIGLPRGQTGLAGQAPALEIGSVGKTAPGGNPTVSVVFDRTEPDGTPVYKLNITLPTGDNGKPIILQAGTILAGAPGTPPEMAVVFVGTSIEGNPIYQINLTIPAGKDGTDGVNGSDGIDGADGLDGTDGKEVELRADGGAIQWRLTGEPWENLIPLSDLKGDPGDRGDQGKPLVVLPNGNYGNWSESTGQYEDSGVLASATVDLDSVPVDSVEASILANVESGDTVPTAFGRLRKWFSAFGKLAWRDRVDYLTELENAPAIPGKTSELTNDSGFTTASSVTAKIKNHNEDPAAHPDFEVITIVDALPAAPAAEDEKKIFSVPSTDPQPENNRKEYYWDGSGWEVIGGNGSGVTASHKLVIDLEPNWGGALQYLIGELVEVVTVSGPKTYVFNGSPIVVHVEPGSAEVIPPKVSRFKNPDPYTIATVEGGEDYITLHYRATSAAIDWTRSDKTNLEGKLINVSCGGIDEDMPYAEGMTIYLPSEEDVAFKPLDIDLCHTTGEKTVTMTYDEALIRVRQESGHVRFSSNVGDVGGRDKVFAKFTDTSTGEVVLTTPVYGKLYEVLTPMRPNAPMRVDYVVPEGIDVPLSEDFTVGIGSLHALRHTVFKWHGLYVNLQTNILSSCVIRNASWEIVGESPLTFGGVVKFLFPKGGTYTIIMADVAGWVTPVIEPITITAVHEVYPQYAKAK